MNHIEAINRDQLQLSSLDMMVDPNSMVRVLDVFLDFAQSYDLGFKKEVQTTGRPSYPERTLLSIYLYGYLHQIRSSRKLEKACKVNVELMWLVKGHRPCYKTIANFRKDNGKGFRKLFKLYRRFLLEIGLYGRDVVAIDGSKFRGQNSKKNNYNERKIKKHLAYIEDKQTEYLKALDEGDTQQSEEAPIDYKKKLSELKIRRSKYEGLQSQLSQTEETQISTVDPDTRALPLHMNIVEVGYNTQSAVDDKHNLIVEYKVTNKNDSRALSEMAIGSKSALEIGDEEDFTVLADKGYHTGEELKKCHSNNIETVVAVPRKSKSIDKTKPRHLQKDRFKYNKETDIYICPNGETLTKQATYRRKDRRGKPTMRFDRYTIRHTKCIGCPFHEQCVSAGKRKSSQGRSIDRYYTDEAVQRNTSHVNKNKSLYKRRQAIVEHPFGTIKRGWGYTYTLMKTIPKVETEFSIIMLCYNLRRSMSILGLKGLKEALKRQIIQFLVLLSCVEPQNHRIKSLYHHSW